MYNTSPSTLSMYVRKGIHLRSSSSFLRTSYAIVLLVLFRPNVPFQGCHQRLAILDQLFDELVSLVQFRFMGFKALPELRAVQAAVTELQRRQPHGATLQATATTSTAKVRTAGALVMNRSTPPQQSTRTKLSMMDYSTAHYPWRIHHNYTPVLNNTTPSTLDRSNTRQIHIKVPVMNQSPVQCWAARQVNCRVGSFSVPLQGANEQRVRYWTQPL